MLCCNYVVLEPAFGPVSTLTNTCVVFVRIGKISKNLCPN